MTDIALNSEGDLDFSNSGFQLTSGTDAVLQKITLVFKTIRGEWFANRLVGLPAFDTIFKSSGSDTKILFDNYLKKVIVSIDGVDSLVFYNSVLSGKLFEITITIVVQAGDNTFVQQEIMISRVNNNYTVSRI